MTPPALISAQPYQIRCAEVWGGTVSRQDEVATPGVRAAIHSSASAGDKGGDIYYISVCAFDTLTRIAIADVRGHGLAVSQLSEWLYGSLEARMNDADGARVLRDLNEIISTRGFSAITTAVIATLHRDKGLLYYCYAGHPPLMLTQQARRGTTCPPPRGPARRICHWVSCRTPTSFKKKWKSRRAIGSSCIPTVSQNVPRLRAVWIPSCLQIGKCVMR